MQIEIVVKITASIFFLLGPLETVDGWLFDSRLDDG